MPADLPADPALKTPRQRWMAVLARATAAEIAAASQPFALPAHRVLRGPEAGLVMVRGRAGGGGGAFNLGEMSVTRCTIRDDAGRIGHAYVAGRDAAQAEIAARLDALLQDDAWHDRIEAAVIAPLAEAQATARLAQASLAAATKVQFFTLATMRSDAQASGRSDAQASGRSDAQASGRSDAQASATGSAQGPVA